VFAGFCLVAAVSSSAFIKTISDQILKDVEQAKKAATEAEQKASETQSVIRPIIEKEIEPEPPGRESAARAATIAAVNDSEINVLKELTAGAVFRTRTGVARKLGIERQHVVNIMNDLKSRALVDSKELLDEGQKKTRWYITNKGREVVKAPEAAAG